MLRWREEFSFVKVNVYEQIFFRQDIYNELIFAHWKIPSQLCKAFLQDHSLGRVHKETSARHHSWNVKCEVKKKSIERT